MSSLTFFAHGEPKGQPRPRAFARKFGATYQARMYDSGTADDWKSQIAIAAKPFIPAEPLTGPIRVDLTFYFQRPKSHYRTGRRATEMRGDAPTWHTSRPDFDNLAKGVLDAMTVLGVWRDDSQVCAGSVSKFYTCECPQGCQVTICQLDPPVEKESAA